MRTSTLVAMLALSFTAAVGEGQPPPGAEPASTESATPEAAGSGLEAFLGTYHPVDTSQHAAVIDRAIETGTESMSPLRRRVGRKRLHAVNVPVRVFRIEREGDLLVTDYDGHRYAAPLSGAPASARDPDGEPVEVTYRIAGRTLRARYVGPDGEKLMVFERGDDGRLTMHVTLRSDQLPEPIRYSLAFRAA